MSTSLRVWYSAVCALGATAIAGGLALAGPNLDAAPGRPELVHTDVVLVSNYNSPLLSATSSAKAKVKQSQRWQSHFSAAMGPLNDSVKAFDSAAKAKDYPAMQAACEDLRSAANAMGATLPAPREDLDAALGKAVGDFKSAGSKCGTLTPDAGQDAVQSVITDIQNGVSDMQSASAVMNSQPE